jgi:hypothetical protein
VEEGRDRRKENVGRRKGCVIRKGREGGMKKRRDGKNGMGMKKDKVVGEESEERR